MEGATGKINQKRGLFNFLAQLDRVTLSLMRSVLTPLAKSILVPLGLTAVASATDAAIQKKIYGSGITTLIISNKEMKDILKRIKHLEELGLLVKAKEQKGGFIPILSGTLAASILGNALAVTREGQDF